jgi:hypothetical protein
MSLETILSILGFGLSVGAYYPLFALKDKRREIAVVSLTTIICVVTAWYAIKRYQYDVELNYVTNVIRSELQKKPLTFEGVRNIISDTDASIISDALHKLLREYAIDAEVTKLKDDSGEAFDVQLYRAAKIEI